MIYSIILGKNATFLYIRKKNDIFCICYQDFARWAVIPPLQLLRDSLRQGLMHINNQLEGKRHQNQSPFIRWILKNRSRQFLNPKKLLLGVFPLKFRRLS